MIIYFDIVPNGFGYSLQGGHYTSLEEAEEARRTIEAVQAIVERWRE